MNHQPHPISIREGTTEDAEFFLEMEEQTTWESLPPAKCAAMSREELRASLLETHGLLLSCPGNIFFIAQNEETGERAGLLWLGPRHNLLTGEHEAWIYNVTVVPECRGCGVGKSLMAHAESYAREQGYAVIGLSVAVHNEIARGLYQRLDYREDNILMRKPLQVLEGPRSFQQQAAERSTEVGAGRPSANCPPAWTALDQGPHRR